MHVKNVKAWMYQNICTHSTVARHLGCVQFGAVMNNIAMSILANLWMHVGCYMVV